MSRLGSGGTPRIVFGDFAEAASSGHAPLCRKPGRTAGDVRAEQVQARLPLRVTEREGQRFPGPPRLRCHERRGIRFTFLVFLVIFDAILKLLPTIKLFSACAYDQEPVDAQSINRTKNRQTVLCTISV